MSSPIIDWSAAVLKMCPSVEGMVLSKHTCAAFLKLSHKRLGTPTNCNRKSLLPVQGRIKCFLEFIQCRRAYILHQIMECRLNKLTEQWKQSTWEEKCLIEWMIKTGNSFFPEKKRSIILSKNSSATLMHWECLINWHAWKIQGRVITEILSTTIRGVTNCIVI